MPTENPRVMVTVDEKMLDQIEEYRYKNKISTRAKATVELIQAGMDELEKRKNPPPGNPGGGLHDQLDAMIDALSQDEAKEILEFVEFLLWKREQRRRQPPK